MKLSCCLLLAAVALTLGEVTTEVPIEGSNPVVGTTYGEVKGAAATSRDGKTFHQFLGIPYGKAKRFEAPTNPDAWTDVRDATAFGPICPQAELKLADDGKPKAVLGSEDCLNLNVFTPKLPEEGKDKVLLPVIVWFHSGAGEYDGAASYDAQYFMDTNAVLVTLNARLGSLGFLNLGVDEASGNQRLKDQLKALEFVRDNIEKFGGDKDRVTLLGQNNGAAEVEYHVISPRSAGLFHQGISEGGSALAPWYFIRDPLNQAKMLGKEVGCPVEKKAELLECLKGKDLKDIIPTFHRWFQLSERPFVKFGPSVERTDPAKAFLTQNPAVAYKEGKINKVPRIIGVQLNEGSVPVSIFLMKDKKLQEKVNNNFHAVASHMLDYDISASDSVTVTKKIAEFYLPGKLKLAENNLLAVVNLTSDRQFFKPAFQSAVMHSEVAPVYAFVNSNNADCSLQDILQFSPKLPGGHGDDVSYMFSLKSRGFKGIDKDSPDYELSKNIVGLWASFAENGKPTKTWAPNKEWTKYDAATAGSKLYQIDKETGTYSFPEDMQKRHAFWNGLYANELKAELENPPEETF